MFDWLQEPRNLLGWVLSVGINGNQEGGALRNRFLDPVPQRRALAVIARMREDDAPCPPPDVPRPVRRAVIDNDQMRRRQGRAGAGNNIANGGCGLIRGDDDREVQISSPREYRAQTSARRGAP